MAHTAESLQAAFKYLWLEEVQALKELAQSLSDNPVVVNIGAGSGTSGLAFIESREDLTLITIDIESQNSPLGSLYSEKSIFVDANIPDGRYSQICADSIGVGKHWLSQPVDMVFIDGDHDYTACKGDIEAWLPNIKPGGIIAIHDYKKQNSMNLILTTETTRPRPKRGRA